MPFDAASQPQSAPRWRSLSAEEGDSWLSLSLEGRALIQLRLEMGATLHVHLERLCPERPYVALWAACYWLLARDAACQRLAWHLPEPLPQALTSGLLLAGEQPGQYLCERALFWQLPQPWLGESASVAYPQQMQISNGKRHPRRAPKPRGEVYRRFDTRLGSWVSLRTLEIEHDLERFNRWQNNPRVEAFWQEGGTLAQHREYLGKLEADPHALTLIGCFDDQPFAYFEAYWAKEDRIAPYYPADDYDRGIHMLVGRRATAGRTRWPAGYRRWCTTCSWMTRAPSGWWPSRVPTTAR